MENLLELGVGLAATVVVLKVVFDAWIKMAELSRKKKTSYPPPPSPLSTNGYPCAQQVSEIYRVVMATDGQGRALIYTPTEIGKLLERVIALLEQEKDHHKEILRILREETTGPFHHHDGE